MLVKDCWNIGWTKENVKDRADDVMQLKLKQS